MRSRAIALAGCLVAVRAFAADVEVESRITAVTVYSDRADVRRVAENVRLDAGSSRLRFAGLPMQLVDDSVRFSGVGAEAVRIADVEELPAETPVAGRDEELERAEAERERLEARKAGLVAGAAFLQGVQMAGRGTEAMFRATETDWLSRAARALVGEVEGNARQTAETDRLLEQQKTTLDALHAERRERDGRATRAVLVHLLADRPTVVDVTLDYAVTGVSWTPEYDVRASGDLRHVELVYTAAVSQASGEDWNGAEIQLSTGRPADRLAVQELDSWWLSSANVERSTRTFSGGSEMPMTERSGVTLGDHLFVRGGRSAPVSLVSDSMIAQSGAFSTTFRVPGYQTLATDGGERRMQIVALKLETAIHHECVPRRTTDVYVLARTRNPGEHPLLPGPSRVLVDEKFIGRGRIEGVAPGQEFTLALGVDPRVHVERKVVDREAGESRERVGYQFDVENFRDESVTLSLVDQVPLSAAREVEIQIRRVEPPQVPDEEGILRWELAVPAKGESRAELAYEARFPKGRRPPNL